MISVQEARTAILAHVRPMPVRDVKVADALGRTLRETVTATRAQPPFDASAMDGYAVRSGDTPGRLRAVGEAGAGHGLDRALAAGECARIFTGAPLPAGADAVLIQEDAERIGEEVMSPRVEARRHVRPAGVDFEAGAPLLAPGRALSAVDVALAAAAGRALLCVARRPRIAVLSGGDEIVPPESSPTLHQIFDSVSYGVAALASGWGAVPVRGVPFTDDAAVLVERVREALRVGDVIVVIGGASVGEHDHARGALRQLGAEMVFEKISLRPGKPTWFARCDGKLVLGLPGNPASALVCARLFLRPLIARLLDRTADDGVRYVKIAHALAANGPRETYLRALLRSDECGQQWAECPGNQDSSLLSVFAACNTLVRRAPDATAAAPGEIVEALDF